MALCVSWVALAMIAGRELLVTARLCIMCAMEKMHMVTALLVHWNVVMILPLPCFALMISGGEIEVFVTSMVEE